MTMTKQKKKVYAVVLGAFRQEFELYTTLSYLCECRKRGIIDYIIVSTWVGEADHYNGLRSKLESLGIILVESEPLSEDTPYGNLNYLRQSRQMKAALEVVPYNSIILKSRTDLSNFDLNRMGIFQTKIVCMKTERFGDFDSGLSYKLSVLCCGITCPFAFYDVTYLGVYEDIRKICTTDNCMLSIGIDVWPDVWLFAPYFATRYPVFEEFFCYIDHRAFTRIMMKLSKDSDVCLPDALNKFYALYFVIIYQCINIYRDEAVPADRQLSLTDMFTGIEMRCIRRSSLVEIRSNRILDQIISGKLKMTAGYRKLLDEMDRIRVAGYAESLHITMDDYEELKSWGRDNLNTEPEEWLRSFKRLDKDYGYQGMESIGFDHAEEVLFSDYSLDEEGKAAIKDVAYDPDSYYGHLISVLPVFEKDDPALYRKALFNAARYADDDVILRIAKLLNKGTLTAE